MSGYLRRLARRTLGQETRIHPAPAFSFADLPTVAEPLLAMDATASFSRTFRAPHTDGAAPRSFTTEPTVPSTGVSRRSARAEDPAPAGAEPTANSSARGAETILAPPSTDHGIADRVLEPLVVELRPQHVDSTRRGPAGVRGAPARDFARRLAPAEPHRHVGQDAHAWSQRNSPGRSGPAEHLAIKAQAAVPDVHVHIGRIEVTAVAPSERPKPESRDEPKRLSLSEYLQRPRTRPR